MVSSTKKSRIGRTQDGATTTTTTASSSAGSASELHPNASCMTTSVPELTTTTLGTQSANPGAVGSEEPAAPGAAECAFWLGLPNGSAAFTIGASKPAGMKMDSHSGEELMDGFLMCSQEM